MASSDANTGGRCYTAGLSLKNKKMKKKHFKGYLLSWQRTYSEVTSWPSAHSSMSSPGRDPSSPCCYCRWPDSSEDGVHIFLGFVFLTPGSLFSMTDRSKWISAFCDIRHSSHQISASRTLSRSRAWLVVKLLSRASVNLFLFLFFCFFTATPHIAELIVEFVVKRARCSSYRRGDFQRTFFFRSVGWGCLVRE